MIRSAIPSSALQCQGCESNGTICPPKVFSFSHYPFACSSISLLTSVPKLRDMFLDSKETTKTPDQCYHTLALPTEALLWMIVDEDGSGYIPHTYYNGSNITSRSTDSTFGSIPSPSSAEIQGDSAGCQEIGRGFTIHHSVS